MLASLDVGTRKTANGDGSVFFLLLAAMRNDKFLRCVQLISPLRLAEVPTCHRLLNPAVLFDCACLAVLSLLSTVC